MKAIFVEYHDLPTTIRGFTRENIDCYVIVINARMSEEMRRKTYRHELKHIENDDLASDKDIGIIETLRHKDDREP